MPSPKNGSPVAAASPMGRLSGTANQVVIQSRRYHDNPLVVTGPGAGAQVTASYGVVNIPREAGTVAAALQLADTRMYSHKRSRSRPRREDQVDAALARWDLDVLHADLEEVWQPFAARFAEVVRAHSRGVPDA